MKIYDKGYHMIWHDCVGKQAYDDVQEWIQMRMKLNRKTEFQDQKSDDLV